MGCFALRCCTRWHLRAKSCAQMSHRNGFSPECTLSCLFRFPLSAKLNPQPAWLHTNGLSPVCVLTCRFSADGFRNALLHAEKGHVCSASPAAAARSTASVETASSSSSEEERSSSSEVDAMGDFLRLREEVEEVEEEEGGAEVVTARWGFTISSEGDGLMRVDEVRKEGGEEEEEEEEEEEAGWEVTGLAAAEVAGMVMTGLGVGVGLVGRIEEGLKGLRLGVGGGRAGYG